MPLVISLIFQEQVVKINIGPSGFFRCNDKAVEQFELAKSLNRSDFG